MWSSWEKASKGFNEALEKTGDAAKGLTASFEKAGEAITQAATKATPKQPDSGNTENTGEGDKRNPSMSGMKMNMPNMNMNLDKGEMLKSFQSGWSSVVESTKRTVDATREAVESEKLRLEQAVLQRTKRGFYKRDPKLPLDVDALRDAEVVYITDRIISLSHPAMASNVQPNITAERKLAAVGQLLNKRHDGRYDL